MSKFEQKYLDILNASPFIRAFAKPGRRVVRAQYFDYNTRIGSAASPLALNVPQLGNIETQADSDFVATYMTAGVLQLATSVMTFNRNVAFQVQDLSTGKNFFSQATIMGLLAGAGGFPYVFPAPRVINPNTNLAITVTNRDTATNYEGFFIAFHGMRLFYAG